MKDNRESMQVLMSFEETAKSFEIPVFEKRAGVAHIKAGNTDSFFMQLDELARLNELHSSILRFKIDQVAGQGFLMDEENVTASDKLENINSLGGINDMLPKIAYDSVKYGGFALLVTWSRDYRSWVEINHIPFDKVRCMPVNARGEIDQFVFRYDWTKTRQPETIFEAYNYNQVTQRAEQFKKAVQTGDLAQLDGVDDLEHTQLLYFKPYSSDSFYYPYPDYIACLSSIRADISVNAYSEKGLANGMNDITTVTFLGEYNAEQKKKTAGVLMKNHTGAAKTGAPLILFAKTKEKAPIIDKVKETGSEKKFKTIAEQTRQKILSGHRVTNPNLMGIPTTSGLGSKDELITAYTIFFTTVIKPKQLEILKVFNRLMKINDYPSLSIDKLDALDTANTEVDEDNTEVDEPINNEL